MTTTEKNKIVDEIMNLLIQLAENNSQPTPENKPVEMLTIKECTEVIQGLSEHTVRQLVAQNKIKSVRTGEGKRGKILVNKSDLISYFQK
jgi:excisionase family DNA binding protein